MSSTNQSGSAAASERAFRSLVRTLGLLERVMQPYFAQFGISGAQWGVLRTLFRAEQAGETGLRLVDLGERLLIRPPSVTGVIDRLERTGLVARAASATDLRAKHVALTAKGRHLVDKVLLGHQAQYDRVMGVLSEAELRRLHQTLTRLDEHFQTLANGDAAASA